MERRAGHIIENFAEKSITNARKTAFEKEMSDPSILRHVCQDVEFTKEKRDGSGERDSEPSRLEEDKTPFENYVTHVTYDQDLGSTVVEDEFQGITTTSVCQDGELITKNKEGSENGESKRNYQAQLGDADYVSVC